VSQLSWIILPIIIASQNLQVLLVGLYDQLHPPPFYDSHKLNFHCTNKHGSTCKRVENSNSDMEKDHVI